jgi:hypothetical protein
MKIRTILFATSLLLAGCASMLPEYYLVNEVITKYGNGENRTQFFYKHNKIVGKATLWDSTGAVVLENSKWDKSGKDLNYLKLDSTETKNPDLSKIAHEIGPKWDSIVYKNRFPLGEAPSFIEYLFWINSNGKIEHAIPFRMAYVDRNTITRMTEDIEKISISRELVGSGLLVKQKLIIDTRRQSTF